MGNEDRSMGKSRRIRGVLRGLGLRLKLFSDMGREGRTGGWMGKMDCGVEISRGWC